MIAIRERARRDWAEAAPAERVVAVLLGVVALAIRLAHVRQTMRHDEAYTFLHYASAPLSVALSDYTYPNNHLFHTLLVWISTRLFGSSEIAIRLPAFVFGMLVVPATYRLARRFADRGASLLAMALAAVWPALVLYSTNARGYSFITLVFIGMLLLGDEIVERDTRGRWVALAVLFAMGMYTAPFMLYAGGAVLTWILVEKARRDGIAAARALLPGIVASAVLTAVITVLVNVPAVNRTGLASLVANKYVTALGPREFLSALPEFAGSLKESLALGVPLPLLAVLVACAVAGVVVQDEERGRRLVLASAVLGWCALLLVATRRPPPGRVLLFLVPLFCVFAGRGMALVAEWVALRTSVRVSAACATVAVLFALVFGVSVVQRRVVFRTPETGTLADAPSIARYLLGELHPGDRIVVMNPSDPPLDYYLLRIGKRRLDEINARGGAGRVFVVVNPKHLQTLAAVQAGARDVPWPELVQDGSPVEFQPETVYRFRTRE
jgi:4-amino-4-deoxy-L-arabinose transferase-like glycosyltransferase